MSQISFMVAALEAENARLRKALTIIASYTGHDSAAWAAKEMARGALQSVRGPSPPHLADDIRAALETKPKLEYTGKYSDGTSRYETREEASTIKSETKDE